MEKGCRYSQIYVIGDAASRRTEMYTKDRNFAGTKKNVTL